MTRPTPGQSQWLFSDQELLFPPSCIVPDRPQDRLTRSQDKFGRAKAVQRIWHIRDALQIPLLPVASAAVFMHRFYMRQTMQQWDTNVVATAALFLASKVEERSKSLRHFIQACLEFSRDVGRARDLYLSQPHSTSVPTLDERDPSFKDLKARVLKCEEVMLNTLCFDLEVQHAFPIVVKVVEKHWRHNPALGTDVARVAWQFVTDSLPSTLMLRHRPQVVAAAAIVGACVHLDTDLPLKPWSLLSEAERTKIENERTEEGEDFEPEPYWLETLTVEPEDVVGKSLLCFY
ncbi:hypothetical protein OIV83_001913 [Microbotryomycetes sp. JL201]|nr:hypothetical protein OIV83_001913 [Microbotryomycetes sp. JL201]